MCSLYISSIRLNICLSIKNSSKDIIRPESGPEQGPEPAPRPISVYFSIFTADDATYDQLNGSQNFQLNPLFCNDSSAVVAENSPAIGNSEIGGNIGGVEIGCGPILFTPIITLLDQNFDEIGEFINMLEDDTLQLYYSVF